MLISLLSSSEWEGPSRLQGGGTCVESLVDMIGLISVHFITYNKKGRLGRLSPVSVINQVSLSRGSKSKQSKHITKTFLGFRGTPCWEIRFSAWLVRVFICLQVGKSRGRWHQVRHFLEIFKAAMACIGISVSWGFWCFVSSLNVGGPP